ncbi:hypothetical protein AB0H29_00140 [Streptomyces thermolilacinus]
MSRSSGPAPVEYGWTGSYGHGTEPWAAALADGAPMAGGCLIVLAGTNGGTTRHTRAQTAQVAGMAVESARAAERHHGGEGPLGRRPGAVGTSDWRQRTVTRETPTGRALTEHCALNRSELGSRT